MRLLHTRAGYLGDRLCLGGHARDHAEIREFMSGNLCRCAAYPNIVDAINQGKRSMQGV
jgi:aerobic-type carbon monoxide dehydrogenase small subunit (CoxS/CutS family)